MSLRKTILTAVLLIVAFSPHARGDNKPADICAELRAGARAKSAPPSVKPVDKSVRVVAFGDFGDGSERQQRVARALAQFHDKSAFDFGLTLGDNFYADRNAFGLIRRRLDSPTHPWWETRWENLYSALGVRFYATLGNHDYREQDPEALLRRESETWCLPRTYYTFTAGPAQFFALDTNEGQLDREQLEWLERELKASRALWKIVYGHHPVKSDGDHARDDYITRTLYGKTLLPRLKAGGADMYISGHEHDFEYLEPEGGVELFIAGSGGKAPRRLRARRHRVWGLAANGFAVIEADEDELTVKFVNTDAKTICAVTLRKGKSAELRDCQER